MRTSRPVALFVLVSLGLLASTIEARDRQPKAGGPELQLYRNLPRDPLLALGFWLDDPASGLAGLESVLDRFTGLPDKTDGASGPAAPGRRFSTMLEDQLLPTLGPELAFSADLPAVDDTAAALQHSQGDAMAMLLGRIGILARVRDRAALDLALRQMVGLSGGEIHEVGDTFEVVLPLELGEVEGPTAPARAALRLHYAIRGDRWAAGFSKAWVEAALFPRPQGQRLIDGEDFKRVFARLDARPSDLVYLNLPRLRSLVDDSKMIQSVVRTNAELEDLVTRFFTPGMMGVGMGSTSVALEDGARTTNFGPSWLSGPAVSGGLIAALALPSLLNTPDSGRSRRTLTDIRAIAEACEGFSFDSRNYPGPTEGWVPVERIAAYLEPVYIGRLPRTDGWHNPILYWSDGGSYRIVSTGGDGLLDRDWTGDTEPSSPSGTDGDIVFGDGRVLASPAGIAD